MSDTKPVKSKRERGVNSNIIYARGFPYGAPLFMIRGGATKQPEVQQFLKLNGFTYDGEKYAWTHYLNRCEDIARLECVEILKALEEDYLCTVYAKKTMDANYILAEFDTIQPEYNYRKGARS